MGAIALYLIVYLPVSRSDLIKHIFDTIFLIGILNPHFWLLFQIGMLNPDFRQWYGETVPEIKIICVLEFLFLFCKIINVFQLTFLVLGNCCLIKWEIRSRLCPKVCEMQKLCRSRRYSVSATCRHFWELFLFYSVCFLF